MNTALKTTGNSTALAALSTLKAGLANIQNTIRNSPKGASGEPILRLGRDGVWVYGADNVEIEPDSLWALNPLSLRHGWICWKVLPEGVKGQKAELYGEHTYLATETLPPSTGFQAYDKDNHPVDHAQHPWTEQLLIDMACISGEDAGTQVIYKTNSTGGLRAMNDYREKLDKQLDDDMAHPVMIVRLKSDHYPHPTWGKTYYPVLEFVRWASLDETSVDEPEGGEPAAVEPKPEVQQEQPHGRRHRAAPAEAEQPQQEEQKPTEAAAPVEGGRRRRRGQ